MRKKIIKKAMAISLSLAISVGLINPPIEYLNNNLSVYADDFENSISAFPDSYKPYLRNLHKQHPNWTYTAFNTGLDFNTAVVAEASNNRSLVENEYSDYLKSNAKGDYNSSTGQYIAKDSGRWVSASKNTVSYFMDPRNFIKEDTIFMFENLSYDKNKHTQSGVEGVLSGSFMSDVFVAYNDKSGNLKTIDTKFSKAIMDAASASKVSPYYIASKMLQEIGRSSYSGFPKVINGKKYGLGAGSAINGKHKTYPGIYNFYNIGASDGDDPVSRGLKWASSGSTYERPWNTPVKSIKGGAVYIGEKYINCGQYTPYFQRFNVNSKSSYDLYTHQYMTAIPAVAQEAKTTYNAYVANNGINTALNFVIPVYDNMPSMDTTIHIGSDGNRTGTVNDTINTRTGPSVGYDIIGRIKPGTRVTIIDYVRSDTANTNQFLVNPYWYKVSYTDGDGAAKTSFVSARFVDVDVTDEYYLGVAAPLDMDISNEEKAYFMTDNPAVATVDDDGNVTGVKEGTTNIRAYTVSGKCSVVGIKIVRIGVKFSKKKYYIPKNGNLKITANVYTLLEDKSVTYTVANTNIATVDASGNVKGKNYGTTTLTATTNVDKKKATCTIQVVKPVEKITLNRSKKNISVGNTFKLVASFVPKDASVQLLKWSSSNKSIAKVSKEGLVTAVKPGTCEITAKSVEGGKTAKCVINVIPKAIANVSAASYGYDRVKIKWDVQAGVTGYVVFKQNTSNKKYTKLATIEGANNNTYIDKGLKLGQKYRYKVKSYIAINGKDYRSTYSKVAGARPKPARGKIKYLKNKKRSIKVKFRAVRGATNYQVFRKDSVSNKYKKIAGFKSNKTYYFDKKVKKGVTYTYKVRAIVKVGKKNYKGKCTVEKSISR